MAVQNGNLKRYRILFIVPSLSGGGSERFIYTLSKHISKIKFDVWVYVINSKKPLYKYGSEDHVNLIKGETKRVRYSILKLYRITKSIKPDIIFSTLGYLNIYLGIFSSIFKNIKLVGRESIVIDKYLNDKANVKNPRILKFLYNYAYPKLDLLVCQSQDMYNSFISEKINLPKTMIINNPVNVEEIISLSTLGNKDNIKAFDLITVGRYNHQKGYDRMIEVMAFLKTKNNQNITLGIIGVGENKRKIEDLIINSGLEKSITLLGQQTNPFPYLQSSRLFLMCSRYEGFPNVLLEAGACGLPVLAYDVPGGINEIIEENSTGHIIPNGQTKIMANKILEALNTAYDKKSIQQITRKKYGLKKIMSEYEDCLVELINSNKN